MSVTGFKSSSRRLKTAYISTVVSIALVLFMLGTLALLVWNARKLSHYLRENIQLSVFFNPKAKDADVDSFIKSLETKEYIKSVEYVSGEEAAEKLKDEIGEDFVKFLGYNPLSATIDVKLKSDYATSEQITEVEKDIKSNQVVQQVYYQPSLVEQVNKNIRIIGIIISGFSILLLIIAAALINNTIRLSIYSKRFLIKTMQLVGATKGYIQQPFLSRGLLNGVYGSLVAILLLAVIMSLLYRYLPEFFAVQEVEMLAVLAIGIIISGIVISYISTYLAVRKFLRLRLDDLY